MLDVPACFNAALNTMSSATAKVVFALGSTTLLALNKRLSILVVVPTAPPSVMSPPVAVTVRFLRVVDASLLMVELNLTPPEPEVIVKLSALTISGPSKVIVPVPVEFKAVCCKMRPAANMESPVTLTAPPLTKKSLLPKLTVKLPV